jgi:hypothetical protein
LSIGVVWLVASTATSTAVSSSPTRVGGEFQAHSYTVNDQRFPSAAVGADGGFVIAWQGVDHYGSGIVVYARRFNGAGAALGVEFLLSSHTTGGQSRPAAALSDDGIFVVAWSSNGQDGSGNGVFARRFKVQGGASLGGEFQVSSLTSLEQFEAAVAMDADADFVVAWRDTRVNNIMARRFDADGIALGLQLQLSSYETGSPSSPAVAMSAAGNFVVAWETTGQDAPASLGIFARRFDAGGAPQGAEFQVNAYTTGSQKDPALDLRADGDFVIAWTSDGQDGTNNGVFARRFDANGVGLGGEFQVNSYTLGEEDSSAVGVEENGSFVVAWKSSAQDGGSDGVFARRFSSTGAKLGLEFQVNSYTPNSQRNATVAIGGDGDLLIAWESTGGQDGSNTGVFAQRFTTLVVLDIDNNGVVDPLTDGLLLLRSGFGFTGTALTTGAIGTGCTRCDSAAIVSYLAGLDGQLEARGSEFQVNTHESSLQVNATVAMDTDGDFAIAWSSDGQDGSAHGIFTRRFDSSGVGRGREFQVNAFTPSYQNHAVAAMGGGDDFVVAWSSDQDGSDNGIFATRFDAGDGELDGEFTVNTFTSDAQERPALGRHGDADFVLAWQSNGQDGSGSGVFARRFNAGGVGLGAELQVNAYTPNNQEHAAVGMDGDGDFVVAWHGFRDGSASGVFARRFNAAGGSIGVEFQVNAYTASYQMLPVVGMNGGGDFVIAWSSFGQDGSSYGIFGRRFDAGGAGLGAEFEVNTYTPGYQSFPAVGMNAGGGFVVAWQSNGQDGSITGVFARYFDAAGTALAREFQVNTYTSNLQSNPAVGMNERGDFVVAWESYGQEQVGSNFGIFAQRFATVSKVDIDGNGSFAALTDGLLVLRFLFGFTGAALVTGAVDVAGCTRCDATAIQAYLQTLI